jgi:hypothetical protein
LRYAFWFSKKRYGRNVSIVHTVKKQQKIPSKNGVFIARRTLTLCSDILGMRTYKVLFENNKAVSATELLYPQTDDLIFVEEKNGIKYIKWLCVHIDDEQSAIDLANQTLFEYGDAFLA